MADDSCIICGAADTAGGYCYHELLTCRACLERAGLPALDRAGERIGRRDRAGRLAPAAERARILAAAARSLRAN